MAGDNAQVEMDGHRFSLTNLSKVLYPQSGTTKADVIGYFAEVAPVMIPLVAGRPVTRKRWPNGVETTPFFHKNIDKGTPSWIPRREIPHSERTITYPLIDSAATLAWLGQNAALELHVPQWRFNSDGSRSMWLPNPSPYSTLDPGSRAAELTECAGAARAIRDRLDDLKLVAYPVTSGSKGMHLYVPIPGSQTSEEVSQFAKLLAETIERDMPELVVSRMSKALRPGKVFIDWSQNNANKTTIAPYSLRGKDLPTVAAPRTWAELGDPNLRHLDYREVLQRLRDGVNPFDPVAAPTISDKLAVYRSKRSADRTPEPVPPPASSSAASSGGDQVPPGTTIRSSSRSTTPPRCTGTSVSNTGECWSPGRCPEASRPPPSRIDWRCRPRITHSNMQISPAPSITASTAAATSPSGTPATTASRSGVTTR